MIQLKTENMTIRELEETAVDVLQELAKRSASTVCLGSNGKGIVMAELLSAGMNGGLQINAQIYTEDAERINWKDK